MGGVEFGDSRGACETFDFYDDTLALPFGCENVFSAQIDEHINIARADLVGVISLSGRQSIIKHLLCKDLRIMGYKRKSLQIRDWSDHKKYASIVPRNFVESIKP
jgi:hypothetical protein